MVHNMRRAIPLVVFALALGSSACGGSNDAGGGSDQARKVVDAAREAWTSTDPAICTELTTEAFIRELYGRGGEEGLRRCKEGAASDAAASVEVSNAEVSGGRATVEVAITGGGGPGEGQTLKHALVKKGGQWKRDAPLSVAHFDREAYLAAARQSLLGEERYSREQKECLLGELAKFSDEELQRFGFSASGSGARRLARCAVGR
jgi:hypothetical protein